jgi:hypothetical protein
MSYTFTKQSISEELSVLMERRPILCQQIKDVGDEAKKEMGVEFDILEIYSIMHLLENHLHDEPYLSRTLMIMIRSCELYASNGDSTEMASIIKYYQECFEKKVKVCMCVA